MANPNEGVDAYPIYGSPGVGWGADPVRGAAYQALAVRLNDALRDEYVPVFQQHYDDLKEFRIHPYWGNELCTMEEQRAACGTLALFGFAILYPGHHPGNRWRWRNGLLTPGVS